MATTEFKVIARDTDGPEYGVFVDGRRVARVYRTWSRIGKWTDGSTHFYTLREARQHFSKQPVPAQHHSEETP